MSNNKRKQREKRRSEFPSCHQARGIQNRSQMYKKAQVELEIEPTAPKMPGGTPSDLEPYTKESMG